MSKQSVDMEREDVLFAQISDLHISGPGEMSCGVAPVSENLIRAITYINAMDPQPQLTLVTGDILQSGDLSHAREAARLLSALRMPWYVIPGNHDDRAALREAFAAQNMPTQGNEFIQYSFDVSGLRFIALDTSGPGVPGGTFCKKRADWLDAELARNPQQPTVLFFHHPPVKFGILETDEDGFSGSELLGDVVEGYPAVKYLLCGHTHLALYAHWRGARVSTAPPVSGMGLSIDLTMKKPSAFYLDDPAFFLHKWTQDNNMLSYLVNVRADDTLHLF